MDRITELLAAGLANLTIEELAELDRLITEETERLEAEAASLENVAALEAVADAADQLGAERDRRDAEQQELEARRQATLDRLRPAEDQGEGDGEDQGEGDGEDQGETPAQLAASGRATGRRPARAPMSSLRRPATADPRRPAGEPATSLMHATVTASGSEVTTRAQVVEAFSREIQRSRSVRTGRISVVTASIDWPEDRSLTHGDGATNETRLQRSLTPEALVAAGGLCAPIENVYDVAVAGSAARPLRDALPVFGADRGGVSLRPGPNFEDWAAGVGSWTLADDINAATPGGADPTKAIIEAQCAGFEDFYVEATTARVRFRNVTTRFDPEMTAANLAALDIAYARIAENKILGWLGAASLTVTSAVEYSATRDLLRALDRLIAAYKSRHRLDDALTLNMAVPRWLKDLIRADLAAGESTPATLAAADAAIQSWFADRNVRPIWHLDGRAAQVGPPIVAAQLYAAMVDGAAVPAFPTTLEAFLWVPGDFLYLDGGTIDLGLVRDSDLNAVNAYETFREEFHGLAFRGTEALRLVAELSPTGCSAGRIDCAAVA